MEKKKDLSLKMKDNELSFFLYEIDYQAKIALAALDELEKYMEEFKNLIKEEKAIWDIKEAKKRKKELEKVKAKNYACKIRIWLMIQIFLANTANISKFFWPPRKAAKKRGLKLREELGISDKSILKERGIRNHFEHFDERIDKWAKKDGNLFHRIIGSLEAIKIKNIDPHEFFHHYDPTTKVITFYREPYHLEDIKNEIQDIRRKVKQNPLFPPTKRNLKRR